MNPLNFFSRYLDIAEMIFHHLAGKELLKLSEVSSDWHEFTASSEKFMAKIKLVHKCGLELSPDNSELLINSSRRYQCLEIICEHTDFQLLRSDGRIPSDCHSLVSSSVMSFVQESNHSWKDVRVTRISFRNQREIWKFLSAIESTVQILSISDVEVSAEFLHRPSSLHTFQTLKFPLLRKLKLLLTYSATSRKTLLTFFLNCETVEEFELRDETIGINIAYDKSLPMKILRTFNRLKILKLFDRNLNQMFSNEIWRGFEFKLRSLIVEQFEFRSPLEGNVRTNFLSFLESQSENLESVAFDQWIDFETLKVILKMSRLKSFSLIYEPYLQHFLNPVNWQEVSASKSTSITDLKFNGPSYNASFIKLLLEAMPNVKTLSVYSLSELQIEYLLSTKRKFEELSVKHVNNIRTHRQTIEDHLTHNFIIRNETIKGKAIKFHFLS